MKNSFLLTALLTIGLFCSCERETVQEIEEVQSTSLEITNNNDDVEGKGNWGRCYYFIQKGLKFNGRCYSNFSGICSVYRICIPDIIFDPCFIIPCWIDIFDPWDIYEKLDPRDFGSFRDKLDIKINPRENVFPFALNERIAGLQFYQEDGFFRDGTFYLEENMILDAETSKELGLQGNVVKAGKYPVIVNKENGTFNAILAVEKGFER